MKEANIFRSNSDHDIMKFNGNSKEFTLGWDVKDNEFRGTFQKPKDEVKATGPATRGTKFLEKKSTDMTPKIGTKGTEPQTISQTARVTRNDREKTTWYFGDKAPEVKKIDRTEKTDKELQKLQKEFDELKTSEKKKKRQEISQMNNQKVDKIAKKAKQREPFRL